MILDAKVLMRDRCFISFLNDRTSLLCERSGPRPGVGQDCGRDNCGDNTGMRHAIIHRAGQYIARDVDAKQRIVPAGGWQEREVFLAIRAPQDTLRIWFSKRGTRIRRWPR